jgi:hypothetical protein
MLLPTAAKKAPSIAVSLLDRNPSHHVRMKFAIIVHCPGRLEEMARKLLPLGRPQT